MPKGKRILLSITAWVARLLPGRVKQAIYHTGFLARLIRSGLNRAAPTGLTMTTIASGLLKGQKMVLDLQSEKDYWLGTYELELQATINDWIKPGWVVYDVGANIGYITLILTKAVGSQGRVFAFEALPRNLERLRENLELNQLHDRVTIVPGAVVEQMRSVQFLVGPSNGMGKVQGSAGRADVHYEGTLDIAGLSLDEFVFNAGNSPPQAIKMDIEGGEVLAIPGMRRLLNEAQPLLLLELHGEESARVTWEALVGSGYDICKMQRNYPIVNSLAELSWKAYLVAIPEWLKRKKVR